MCKFTRYFLKLCVILHTICNCDTFYGAQGAPLRSNNLVPRIPIRNHYLFKKFMIISMSISFSFGFDSAISNVSVASVLLSIICFPIIEK